jgi:hypothetical protein
MVVSLGDHVPNLRQLLHSERVNRAWRIEASEEIYVLVLKPNLGRSWLLQGLPHPNGFKL